MMNDYENNFFLWNNMLWLIHNIAPEIYIKKLNRVCFDLFKIFVCIKYKLKK